MEKSVFLHVKEQFAKAHVHSSPYSYFYIENIFPDEFYQELLSYLPDTSCFQGLAQTGRVTPKTYEERFILPLQDKELEQLPFNHFLFWSKFAATIKSDEWCQMLLEKFGPQIRERFGSDYEKIWFSSTAELLRDRTNYSIGPHTDHPMRTVTLLFYFPHSKDLSHLGTSVYQSLDPSFECDGYAHHSFAEFQKIHTATFLPNSVFGFVRSNRSFHGRELILDEGVERNLLNYYLQWGYK